LLKKTAKAVYWLFLHILILALAAVVLKSRHDLSRFPSLDGVSWSPVREFVRYELNTDHAVDHKKFSIYNGKPTQEQTEAWEELVRPAFFAASREELSRAGESLENIAELEDGGYLATIAVYHELHCLRNLRFYLFRDVYYPNMTAAEEEWEVEHLDHCLEALRQSIMCNGNTEVISFAWDDLSSFKPFTKSQGTAVCVEWKSIEDWAYTRAIPPHPRYLKPLGREE
jgi:hypothetical protein